MRKLAEEHTNIDVVFVSDVDGFEATETLTNWAGSPVVLASAGSSRTTVDFVAFDVSNGAIVDGTASVASAVLDCSAATDGAVGSLVDGASASVETGLAATVSASSATLQAASTAAVVADALLAATAADVAFADATRCEGLAASSSVTAGDLLDAAPHLDEVLTVTMTGAQLEAVLARGVSSTAGTPHQPSSNGQYDFYVDPRTGYGADDLVIDGLDVDDDASYVVAFAAAAAGFANFESGATKTGSSTYAALEAYASGVSDLGTYASEMRVTQDPDLQIYNVAVLCDDAGAAAREVCDAARAAKGRRGDSKSHASTIGCPREETAFPERRLVVET